MRFNYQGRSLNPPAPSLQATGSGLTNTSLTIFNFTLRRNSVRLEFGVRSSNPPSITLRANSFEPIVA